jgi:hypothetical protein
MTEQIKNAGVGPLPIGERVHIPVFQSNGVVIAAGEIQVVRVFDAFGPQELRAITPYTIRLDNGHERRVMDRDGHIQRLSS